MAASEGRLNGNRNPSSERDGRPHAAYQWQPRPMRYAHLTGWGIRLPERVVTNAELEAVVETTDDWIRTRTGIQERRIANDRETVTQMGFEAARAALNRADVLPSAID